MADAAGRGQPVDNPFVVHRRSLDVYRHALALGLDDDRYVELTLEADERIAAVDGVGFTVTPIVEFDVEGTGVLAKVETGAPSGSHKARHLFGLLLRILVDEATAPGSGRRPDLAIASCGNAALGAAVVARSANRHLRVFVPDGADGAVLARLGVLGADVVVCHRSPGQIGDPCVERLDEAVTAGALPFTVQGTRCPDVIDGARTLGLELADQLVERGVTVGSLFVQIGGGALATATMDGVARAPSSPRLRLHPVQALAAHPYVAGWRRLAAAALSELGAPDPGTDRARAELLERLLADEDLPAVLRHHRAAMTPWPGTPHSVASGILDDETYDWATVMAHMVRSGGWPVLVGEGTFVDAAELAAGAVAPPPDATGAAGLAGVLHCIRSGDPDGAVGERTPVVLLTGVDRRVG
ncbi:MAG: PLP-dependent lyase/thiolase [Acidimicrobiales bacterium]